MAGNLVKQKKEISGWIPRKHLLISSYQFWLNASDADAEKWIRIFTFLSRDEIQTLLEKHQKNPIGQITSKRHWQKKLLFLFTANRNMNRHSLRLKNYLIRQVIAGKSE